ncbi:MULTISPECIES: hypothetical protein [Burkholderia]|uniref:hypothetical protein n=1 Tax=Burkholderia TaxID=32008 RepID=UPI00157B7DC2|nr:MULTISPECIES: hypothetical protein [Burkholderia]MCU9953416.1 hypothetical protein [Burkholderia sp. BKH01]
MLSLAPGPEGFSPECLDRFGVPEVNPFLDALLSQKSAAWLLFSQSVWPFASAVPRIVWLSRDAGNRQHHASLGDPIDAKCTASFVA